MPFIHVVIVMGGSTIHHIGADVGGEWCINKVFGGFCKKSIVAVSEFKYSYFEV